MNKKRMLQIKTNALLLAMSFTIFLVAGIPAIVFGATNKITILLIVGITGVVVGFYGTPMAWVRYGNMTSLYHFLIAIEDEKITKISQLMKHLSLTEKTVKENIRSLMKLQCLKGYTIDEMGNLITNVIEEKEERIEIGKCPNCSAPLDIDIVENVRCPYCGIIISHVKQKKGNHNEK